MSKRPSPPKRNDSELEPLLSPLESAIEEERSRLSRARAVLGCLRVALLYSDEGDPDCDAGDFADAAEVARALVGESVQRLDSVKIGPLMKSLKVRECAQRYFFRRVEDERYALASLNNSGFEA